MSSEYGYLALNSGSGEATVSGTGSQWNITTNLNVGGAGHATLDIEAGGTVTTGFSGTIGDASPAVGMVNVSGATSTLNLGSNLIVGRSGSGTLVIEDGGSVESQTGFLGQFAGSQGNVTITGAGSLWTTTGDLYLGGDDTAAGGTGLLSLLNEGQVDVGGALYVHNTGTIHGAGTVIGEVVSSGRVAPGNSPGILTITGDYTQTASSVLEIEVQGYTAGTEHDQLQVSGTATLAGRLEVPILQPFDPNDGPYPPPTPGQSIQFLTAGTRTGEFSAVVSPNLQTLYPGLAIDVAYESGGARLSFAPIKTTVVFDEDSSSTANWFDPNDTWEDTASPGDPVIPTLLHDISIQNLTISAQEVEVVTSNAFVAKLSVGGGSNDLVVKIGGGAFSETMGNLSSTLGVTVVSKGVVAMNGGTLATSTMTLDGGNLIGNGLVGLSSNTSVGTGTLTVSSGIISPGFSVGHLEVDGNYLQTSSGQLSLEVDDPNSFDTLAITGDASLGGTLVVTGNRH